MWCSVRFTELHKHAFLVVYESACLSSYAIAVCIINEHASSDCSLLEYENGIVYQQIIKRVMWNNQTLPLYTFRFLNITSFTKLLFVSLNRLHSRTPFVVMLVWACSSYCAKNCFFSGSICESH